MKKYFLINNRWSEGDIRYLSQYMITPNGNNPICVEDGDIHNAIVQYLQNKKNPLFFERHYYTYSKEEIISSTYCVLVPLGRGGYPQPENFDLLDKLLYDTSRCCKKCGAEHIQVGDYRINKQPKREMWGFTAWELDAIFVTERLYNDVFKPIGIGYRTVRRPSGKIIDGVLQLKIPIINESLDMSMFIENICSLCGRVKYLKSFDKPYFPLHDNPLPHIYLTKELFGDGRQANRRIIISTELALKLIDMKLFTFDYLVPCKKDY